MKKILSIVAFVLAMLVTNRVEAEGVVTGFVFEQDSISPIEDVEIAFTGIGAEGDTLYYQFYSDTTGLYEAQVASGVYQVMAWSAGYSPSFLPDSLWVENDSVYLDINFILNEICHPVRYVEAELFADDYVRVSWSMNEDTYPRMKSERTFRYFDIFRRGFGEEPVMLASHLTDSVFMEMNWSSLPWGKYSWGVSCWYEGNRAASDTIWSVYLDKDMTTSFELGVTTNVGLIPAGAAVLLASCDEQGQAYYAPLDENGHLLLPDVYRDDYMLRIHLDGYESYYSSDTIPVFAPTHVEVELVEKLLDVDSLYVSSTGWAIWHLEASRNRDLQYFEVMLDGQLVATTTELNYQFEVESMEVGRHCLVQVRPVFLSAACEWRAFDWVYQPCSNYQGTVNGLQWTLLEDAVLLLWQYPENVEIEGAMLYRDGEFVGLIADNVFLDEEVVMHGAAEYSLRVVYGGDVSGGLYYSMSCEESVTVSFPVYCEPPTNLEGENYYESETDYGALISWGERPPVIQKWLHYDNGVYKNVIGNDAEPILFWAIRFDAEDLADYQGTTLQKVSLFDVSPGTYQLWVYLGGETAPQTLVRYQNMVLVGANAWHEQPIEPLEVPEDEPIWIVIGQQGLSRPAAACADTGDPDGRWVSMDGTEWKDMHYYNVHYTWMLRAFVSNQSGKTLQLGRENFALQRFNLYRSNDSVDYQCIASVAAMEGQEFYQYRDVLVGTTFQWFYYRLTAVYQSDEGEECESDYAASLYKPDQNFVEIDDHWAVPGISEKPLNVYPNPTSDFLTVEANEIRNVRIFNVFGQNLLDKEVLTDRMQLDLSGFADGMYLLRVTTANGIYSKRFVLSR